MAQGAGKITMPMPPLTVTLRMPPAYGFRLRLACAVIRIASWVCPHRIEIEIAADEHRGRVKSRNRNLS